MALLAPLRGGLIVSPLRDPHIMAVVAAAAVMGGAAAIRPRRDDARGYTPYSIATPEQARQALERDAFAVVVGSMITRPSHITAHFLAGMRRDPSGFPT